MMDQQFLERERELFRLNAKLNAKSKKIAAAKTQIRVQIHTANNNLNHYPEEMQTKGDMMMMSGDEQQQQQLNAELMCKKMHIANQPVKKPQEIVYPLYNRQPTITKQQMQRRVDIHMPSSSLISDGNEDDSATFAGETLESTASFKNESMITKHSYDTANSAIPPAEPIPSMPLPPPPSDIIPKCIEKKISNDGLMRLAIIYCTFFPINF